MLKDDRKIIVRRQFSMVIVLWGLVLVSALGVIYQVHDGRAKFNELQALREVQQVLQVQWSQYILEESAWASFDRIESVAVEQLMMQVPEVKQTVMVRLGDK